MCECWSLYENITGPDLPKTALETDHVLLALHIDQIKSCFIIDDLHMTADFRSKGHLLTPVLMKIRWTRAERLFLLYAKNGHKISSRIRNLSPFRRSIISRKLDLCSKSIEVSFLCAGRPSQFLRHGKLSHQRVTYSFLLEMCKMFAWVYQEDVLQGVVKPLNTTLFNGQERVFQEDSATTQEPRRLRSCCKGSFWPSSEPRIYSNNTIPKSPLL